MRSVAALLLALLACSSPAPDARDPPARALELPPDLREVSGLAAASPGSVFAHDDERAVVHEIDLASGRTIRSFALGSPAARGDFEGIAADRGRSHLIVSDGRLLSASVGADGARMPFEVHDTGAGADCEVEGLSLAPEPGHLLILCKRVRRGGREGRLLIYRWSIDAPAPVRRPWLDVDLREALGEARGFAPSAIEWVAERQRVVVASARGRTLLVLDENGRVLARRRLAAAAHPQPEGLAVSDSGELVIADEGEGGSAGRLTVYRADYLRQSLSSRAATRSGPATSSKKAAR